MKINIKRFNEKKDISYNQEFEVKGDETILSSLFEVKTKYDNSLSFRCGCRSGVCGSCSIRVNGLEKLACKTKINEYDLIEPLNNTKIIKDLIIDLSYERVFLEKTKSYIKEFNNYETTSEDEKLIDVQSSCILCQSCFSSCPVYEVNKDFLGPYALTRALRYVNDKKELDKNSTIENIQDNGIWDCTLCGNCTIVCPQFIDPKTDILNLRIKSVQAGFEDKSLAQFSSGFDSGFDPSGGFDPNGF